MAGKPKAKQLNVLIGQAEWNVTGVTVPSANSVVVTSLFAGKVSGGNDTQVGVYTNSPQNRVLMRNASDGKAFVDDSQRQIYGRLTYLASVWTLSFYVIVAGVETAHNFTGSSYVGDTIQFRWCETIQLANTKPTAVVDGGEGIDEIVSVDPLRHSHRTEVKTVSSDGQTAFSLDYLPKDENDVIMSVNGVELTKENDYTVSGQSVTYLNTDYSLETTDVVKFKYETDEVA